MDHRVRTLIASLDEALTEGMVAFDDDGRAAFASGDGVVIGIDHLPHTDQILLHAEVGYLPHGPSAGEVQRDLLHNSLEVAAAVSGALGIDAETGTVALFARRNAQEFEAETFEAWVGDVAEAAEIWAARLAGPDPVAAA